MDLPIRIDREQLAEFCRRNHIRRLALFGSVLTDDFGPDSDVDILGEYEPGAKVGLFDMAGHEIELTERLGRKVDLRTAEDLSHYFRDKVVASAEVQYAASGCSMLHEKDEIRLRHMLEAAQQATEEGRAYCPLPGETERPD